MSIWGVLVAIICAIWCYKIAEDNGRNTVIATILGLLFNFIAVIVYYLIGPKAY